MAAGTRRWRTICSLVRLERRPCHLCKEPIDYTLSYKDIHGNGNVNVLSFSGDHLIPTILGGQDTYANCGAAHLKCNIRRHADPLPAMANPRTDNW